MSSKIKYVLLLSIIAISASSCKKYLSLEPQDGIVRQDFWKTKEQVASAVNGCYASLLAPPLVENLFLWGELRGDMMQTGGRASANDFNIINLNIQSTNTITNWAALYQTINNCNTVIDFAPQVLNTDNTFKQRDLNGYLGEALALRSLMYFYLVRTFRDVPLKLKATTSDDDDLQIPKSTDEQVLNQIIADLKLAEEYAFTTYGNRDNDKGRITKYAVQALLADVYLWKDDYTNCIAYCDKVINSSQFGLVEGSSWFSTVFYEGGSNESIFEFYFNQNRLNPFYSMFSESSKRFTAALRVAEEVYTIDLFDLENKDIRGDGAALKFNEGTIWKYQGVNSSSGRSPSASFAHWMVYRYADILLLKAEAKAMQGDVKESLSLLKIIRDRASALEATETYETDPADPDYTENITPEDLAKFVLDERAREFAYEGKRWFDLLRNAKRNDYAQRGLLFDAVVSTASPESQQSAVAKLLDNDSHYLPIYFNELETNKKLVQNPFYIKSK